MAEPLPQIPANVSQLIRLESTTGPEGGARIAKLSDGTFLVVWEQLNTQSTSPYAEPSSFIGRVFNAEGNQIGPDRVIAPGTGALQDWGNHGGIGQFDIVGLSGGGYAFVYARLDSSPGHLARPDGPISGIYAQRYDDAGNPVGGEIKVQGPLDYTYYDSANHPHTFPSTLDHPLVAAGPDGGFAVSAFHLVPTDAEGHYNGTVATSFVSASGVVTMSPDVINRTTDGGAGPNVYPNGSYDDWDVAVNKDGVVATVVAEWVGNSDVYFVTTDAAGNPGPRIDLTQANPLGDPAKSSENQPSIAALPNGNFVVTYTNSTATGSQQGGFGASVMATILSPAGAVVKEPFLVPTATVQEFNSRVAVFPDGRFLVVWQTTDGVGAIYGYEMRGQVFAEDGTKIGSEFGIGSATYETPYGGPGYIAILDNDSFAVVRDDEYTDSAPILHVLQLSATPGDDHLFGLGRADILDGLAGNDSLAGGLGPDLLRGGPGDDLIDGNNGGDSFGAGDKPNTADYGDAIGTGVTVDLANGDAQDVGGGLGKDTLHNIDHLNGSDFADLLKGHDGANKLAAGLGDDVLVGRNGNDTLDGGAGTDGVDYSQDGGGSPVTVDLAAGTATDTFGRSDALIGIENLVGSSNNGGDHLTGSAGANIVAGLGANDSIDGADGTDTAVFRGRAGEYHFTELDNGHLVVTDAQPDRDGADDLVHVEQLQFLDRLVDLSGATPGASPLILGGTGDDMFTADMAPKVYEGGGGLNTVDYSALTAVTSLYIDLTLGMTVKGAVSDALSDIQNVVATTGGDAIVGNAFGNLLSGLAGADFIFGTGFAPDHAFLAGSGNDTLSGADGDDGLWGADGNDVITGDIGNDALVGGAGDDSLDGGDGSDFLFGADFAVTAPTPEAPNPEFPFQPGSGNDTLKGGTGDDGLWGGDGEDSLDGGAGNDYVEAGSGNDKVQGGADSDTLLGQAGDDTIGGGGGFDYLYGGSGADTFVFAKGDAADWALDVNVAEGDRLALDGFGFADFEALKPFLLDYSTAEAKATVFDYVDPLTGHVDEIRLFGVAAGELNGGNVLLDQNLLA